MARGAAEPHSLAEAAYYLHLPRQTVRDWSIGRHYPVGKTSQLWKPFIRTADPKQELLSFPNLVELHVIASIRRALDVRRLGGGEKGSRTRRET